MKPTKMFSSFSLITLPFVLGCFIALLRVPTHDYSPSVLPNFLRPPQINLPLLRTSDGQLGVHLYQGIGFHCESMEFITGTPLRIGDRY